MGSTIYHRELSISRSADTIAHAVRAGNTVNVGDRVDSYKLKYQLVGHKGESPERKRNLRLREAAACTFWSNNTIKVDVVILPGLQTRSEKMTNRAILSRLEITVLGTS